MTFVTDHDIVTYIAFGLGVLVVILLIALMTCWNEADRLERDLRSARKDRDDYERTAHICRANQQAADKLLAEFKKEMKKSIQYDPVIHELTDELQAWIREEEQA